MSFSERCGDGKFFEFQLLQASFEGPTLVLKWRCTPAPAELLSMLAAICWLPADRPRRDKKASASPCLDIELGWTRCSNALL